ncbi:hypothetical protein GCM10022416_52670 [Actinomadura keratinilytica]|uniref:Uncharacterized protein n=1 Tax=Actinomadura keratinilytica TaxID=547461 RepID=A0ABP7ZCI0_9ACTN
MTRWWEPPQWRRFLTWSVEGGVDASSHSSRRPGGGGRENGRRLVEAAEDTAGALGCVTMKVTSARSHTSRFCRNPGYQERSDRSARCLKDLRPGA